MDYSTTVNLPKTDFPMKADLPKREPAMLDSWAKEKVYEKALERRTSEKGKKQFILHDGPPYANGNLHLGHALNKILKDIIVRSKTMAGYYAPYVPGWDCHGLPIELQLMKELKVTDKHKVDREKFREQAKAFAEKFVNIQREEFKRMGVLGEWDKPYLTMASEFKQTIVKTFEELQSKGYVYRGKKPVHWCFTDETALAEAELEYENDPGPSIYVAFPSTSQPGISYVIWTTTPWTLPANVAIAYNPGERYVIYETARGKFVLAEKRLEEFSKAVQLTGKIIETCAMESARAKHPWLDREAKVLKAGFVAMDTGTGLVHIAPGHGADDYVLGQQQNPPLPIISPVNDRGLFTDEVPEWQGQHVFKANPLIIEFLKQKGVLLHAGEITHSYPHCWRCHKPVIFRATEQWFLSVEHEQLRDRLMKAIDGVQWIPAYGQNRITGMVEKRPDWCLSRQRLWGTEIPGSDIKKDPDIFDVWFESGVSWAAVLKQPSPWPELSYPADMYLEGSDQHRGWFQTSLIPSVALMDQAPYKAVLTHGFVMDGEGRPMSKSLGNVVSPQDIIKQYGADVLRLWVGSSDYGGDVRLSPEILKGQADNYRKIRNTLRYLLNNLTDFNPKDAVAYKDLPEIDRWALHRMQEVLRHSLTAYEQYEFHRVSSGLITFCGTDLSSFYFDGIKDRLYCDSEASLSRRAAQTVLTILLDHLLRLWAPLLPFTADEAWRFQGHTDSIALYDLPEPNASHFNPELAEQWKSNLKLRDAVLMKIEHLRASGVIKAPREAKLSVRTGNLSLSEFCTQYPQMAGLFSVSEASVTYDPSLGDVEDVEVSKADGVKCARCWIYKKDVGSNSRWPDVCGRCAKVLDDLPKKEDVG